ncbi:MAG: Spi family protease inhibitor [Bacteroidales bacterium]|nr:Spi family protease inhibitor [Bacteroidales bacterium]
MKKVVFLCLSGLILALAACTNTTLTESALLQDEAVTNTLLLERGTTPITAEQAINVAKLFDIQNGQPATKAAETRISDVYTHRNDEGTPVFYAVNRADDKGFIIVSASRKYYPVLAIVDRGHFDNRFFETIMGNWADEQTLQITSAERDELPTDLVRDIRTRWTAFEKTLTTDLIATKSEAEAYALRQACVAAWENQGYTCYALQDDITEMPATLYSSFCASAQALANPDYDYMLFSVVLEERVDDISTYGPYIGSTWGPENGYNQCIEDVYGNLVPVGSKQLAVGQVMRHFQRPTSIANLPLNYATTATSNFLLNISDLMGGSYHSGGNSATNASISTALHHYHYSLDTCAFSRGLVDTCTQSGSPVILCGTRTQNNTSVDYGWVCEGYRMDAIHYEYELRVLSVTEPLEYEFAGSGAANQFSFIHFLYHNLCMTGQYNGWYISNTVTNTGYSFSPSWMAYNITRDNYYY